MRKFLLLSALFVCLNITKSLAQCTPPTTSFISAPASICGLNGYNYYSVTATAGSTYVWTVTGGTVYSIPTPPIPPPPAPPSSDITGISTTSSAVYVMWTASGTQSLTVVETSSAGCVGSPVNLSVTVKTAPAPFTITGPSTSCANVNGVVYSVPNVPGVTYNWSIADGAIVSGAGTNSVTVNWGSDQIGGSCWGCSAPIHPSISLTEVSSNGCIVGSGMSVALIKPSISSSAPNICSGSTATLSPSSGGTWTSSAPSIATVTNSGIVTGVAAGQVSFTFTDSSNGCSNSLVLTVDPTVITINSQSPPSLEACLNVSSTLYVYATGATRYQWYSNSVNSNTGGTQYNGSGSATSGTYVSTSTVGTTYYYAVCSNACTSVSSNVSAVTVGTTPVSVTSQPTLTPQTFCQSAVTPLSVSATGWGTLTYQWYTSSSATPGASGSSASGSGFAISGATGSTYTPSYLGTNYYWVVITNSCGSVYSNVSGAITINSLASITNQYLPQQSICPNSSAAPLQVTASGTGPLTYQWYSNTANSNTGGIAITGATSPAFTPPTSTIGTTYYYLIVTGPCGSAKSGVSGAITIKTPPNPVITGNTSVCANATAVSYSVVNNTGSSYLWVVTGGSYSTQSPNAISVNWGAAGPGNVRVAETNSQWCQTIVDKPVTINPLPVTGTISGPSPVCANTTGAVYSVTNTIGSSYTWTVTGPTGTTFSSNGNTATVNWGVAGSGTVKVTETNSFGCAGATVTKSVTINANPISISIGGGGATACPNSTVSYSVTNTINSSYTWTITGGTQASGAKTNAITVTWGNGGAGNVNVVETNLAGCVGTPANKSVSVGPLTTPISGSATVCPNSNGIAYSVANVTGNTYTWTATGGTVVCGQNTSTILVNWGAAGPGTLNVTERSATCTGVAVNLPVTITATPATSAITGNSTVCSNASALAYSVTNTSGSTYAWTVTGGTLVSGAGTNNITVNWSASGTGNISVIETTSTGCVGIAVNKIITIASVNTGIISGNSSMCLPANGVVYSVANTAGSTYVWSINGGTQASGGTTNSITVNWGPAGPGSVNVKETNSAGCVGNTITESVLVNPKPLTSLISGNAAVCANATGVSYSVTNTTGSSYVWTIAGGTQVSGSTTNSITVNWGAAGAGNVSVVETNYLGCVGTTVAQSVTINAKPSVSIYASSYSICSGSSSTLTASGASSYSWSTGASTVAITVNPSSSTTYTVTGTTNGCSATASATITVGSGYGYVTPSSVDLCTTGGCTTLQAGSGSGYSWSTGSSASSISVCSVGTYTVHYTVNGCSVTASANVYQGTSNQPPIEASVDPVDAKKVEVKGKSTTMAFTQTTGSRNVSAPKDVNHIDTYIPCGPLPQAQQTTQLEKENTSFSIYPNPAFTHATVILSKAATEDSPVLWFDMSGRQVKTSTIEKGNKEKTFQIDELDAGVYLVRVKDNGQLRYSKIIVTK